MTKLETVQMADEAHLLSFCAPIFFLPSANSKPENIAANATIAFIDSGEKKFLVTSAHVWTEFQDYKVKNPEGRLGILFINGFGYPEFLNEKLLIDFDIDLDLAVFNVLPNWQFARKQFHRVFKWPINKANEGDKIAFLGFAAVGREITDREGKFSYSSFGLTVTSVSDRKLVINSSEADAPVFDNSGKIVRNVELGGMSGSPVYILNRQGNFRLTGFIQMGATTDALIFATHAHFLNKDGTLNRQ
jgi:hypothetical protein